MRGRAFLLWLLLLVPLVPAGSPEDAGTQFPLTLFEDTADDAAQAPTGGNLDRVAFGALDVRRLAIAAETEETLTFDLGMGPFEVGPYDWSTTTTYQGRIDINFTVEGQPHNIAIELDLEREASSTTAQIALTRARVASCALRCQGYDLYYAPAAKIDDERDALRFAIRKISLLGATDYYRAIDPGFQSPIREGSLLANWHADAYMSRTRYDDALWLPWPAPAPPASAPPIAYSQYVKDSAPDAGGSKVFTLSTVPWGKLVSIRLLNATLPLAPGRIQNVPFVIHSYAPVRQLFNLSYEFRQNGEPMPAFALSGPRAVYLSPHTSRNLSATIQVPSPLPDEDHAVTIIVRATTPAGDLGQASSILVPGIRLTPTNNKLYLHAGLPGGSVSFPPDSASMPSVPSYLSTRQDETGDDPAQWVSRGIGSTAETWDAVGYATQALASDVYLEPGGLLQVTTKVAARPNDVADLTVYMGLRANATWSYYTQRFAEFRTTLDATSNGIEVTMKARVPETGMGLPATARIGLLLAFAAPDHPSKLVEDAAGERAGILSGATVITLPVLEDPNPTPTLGALSPFQTSTEGAYANYDQYGFLNPGEARLVNMSVTNVDLFPHELTIEANATSPGWSMEIQPGTRFHVPSAEAASVGILFRAPKDAVDGAEGNFTFTARAEDGTVRVHKFRLTATASWDYPDHSDWFVLSPDSVKPVAVAPPETPALGSTAVVAVALLWAWRRRA